MAARLTTVIHRPSQPSFRQSSISCSILESTRRLSVGDSRSKTSLSASWRSPISWAGSLASPCARALRRTSSILLKPTGASSPSQDFIPSAPRLATFRFLPRLTDDEGVPDLTLIESDSVVKDLRQDARRATRAIGCAQRGAMPTSPRPTRNGTTRSGSIPRRAKIRYSESFSAGSSTPSIIGEREEPLLGRRVEFDVEGRRSCLPELVFLHASLPLGLRALGLDSTPGDALDLAFS